MTHQEKLRHDNIEAVRNFLHEQKMNAWDLAKITKELCCCGSCRFFVQHYTRDGEGLDWGHCCRGNIQRSKKQSTASCGFWEDA